MELSRREMFASTFAAALMLPVIAHAGVPLDKYDRLLQRYQTLRKYSPQGLMGVERREYHRLAGQSAELAGHWNSLIDVMMTDFPVPKITSHELRKVPIGNGRTRMTSFVITENGEIIPPLSVIDGIIDKDGNRNYPDFHPTRAFLKSLPDYEIAVAVFKQLVSVDKVPCNVQKTNFGAWAQQVRPIVLRV